MQARCLKKYISHRINISEWVFQVTELASKSGYVGEKSIEGNIVQMT